MTLNVTQHGVTRIYTDVELVEEALRKLGKDLSIYSPTFITDALRDGCSIERVIAIALGKEHELPKREKGAAA